MVKKINLLIEAELLEEKNGERKILLPAFKENDVFEIDKLGELFVSQETKNKLESLKQNKSESWDEVIKREILNKDQKE